MSSSADDPLYEISFEAQNDLFEIWQRIALDSVELANRIESEFYGLFASLAQMPRQGILARILPAGQSSLPHSIHSWWCTTNKTCGRSASWPYCAAGGM